ncbi:glycine betaine/L-proline ABC transporter ATP-binding protein ProV [Rhodospirillaceae bacterium SYSU D60014]|uniref:glycine betaine/L-proline ABC transporter ATP-binding protein ProV n=1 Tax=Virgifigura deserti TaxID=2268457 RepID=UPI000E671422
MTEKIVVKNLYKIFGSKSEAAMQMLRRGEGKDEIFRKTGQTVGVQDASFSVEEGEVFVVMGLSGSGKSTLVRMLNRLIDPTSGEVLIDGRDITRMSKRELIAVRRRDIGMVFQSFALMPHQTVLENAAFGLEVAGVDRAKRQDRALDALDAVGLKPYAASYPDELSGGMKQRVGLARALATDPSILLMDEAFSALDPLIRTEMQDELLRLQQEHARTVVFITHDLDEAMRIGSRIAIMQGGEVVQIGTPEEIVRQPANDYVRSFFRGVDVSQVFTAGDIARREQVTVIERPGLGVRAALEMLREHDRDIGIVIGGDRKFQGVVTVDSLIQQIQAEEEPSYRNAFVAEIEPIPQDMNLSDVLGRVAGSQWPVPVIDDQGRYIGSISKTALLQALDKVN